MFVRPEQVAQIVAQHPEVTRVRVEVGHDGASDTMLVKVETTGFDPEVYATTVSQHLNLRGDIELAAPGTLPRDGVVIADLRPAG